MTSLCIHDLIFLHRTSYNIIKGITKGPSVTEAQTYRDINLINCSIVPNLVQVHVETLQNIHRTEASVQRAYCGSLISDLIRRRKRDINYCVFQTNQRTKPPPCTKYAPHVRLLYKSRVIKGSNSLNVLEAQFRGIRICFPICRSGTQQSDFQISHRTSTFVVA